MRTPCQFQVNEKKTLVNSFSGETVLRGDDFKRYVNSLRGKSNANSLSN